MQQALKHLGNGVDIGSNGQHQKHRINVYLPGPLYAELERASAELGVSQVDMVRQLLKFGLSALRVSLEPGGGVFIREAGGELEKVGLQYLF